MKHCFTFFVFTLLFSATSAHNPLDWQLKYSEYYRHINSVQILTDSFIVIAGGNEFNDKIRSVQLSRDGGTTWNIILDMLDSLWIKSVCFVNPSKGFAVGYEGGILKTVDGGQSWISSLAPGNTSLRNLNSIFFINDQTGFIAGGHETSDSVQTILKTTTGGNSWFVVRDTFGYWLKAIYFTDVNNGFGVGDNGVALKTNDGGTNWAQISLPANTSQRDFNTVFFINATTGFIGGGNKANDSIQTILKTTDAGNSWNIITDALGSWITSIHFPVQYPAITKGFAVGDKGKILMTEDAGDSWNTIAIPGSVNDSTALLSVHFHNLDFGIAGGRDGKLLIYRSSLTTVPIAEVDQTIYLPFDSIRMFGRVNANGSAAKVMFEYGTTTLFGTSVPAIPDTVFGNSYTSVSRNISGLIPNTIYYFRIKAINENGVSHSQHSTFYTGDNPIPNFDFELWDTLVPLVPDGWIPIGNLLRITSYDSSYAVAMTGGTNFDTGAILFGAPSDDGNIYGGVPFTARPDSLIGYFDYNIITGDSAIIFIFFKHNGTINSQNIYYIVGSSNGTFQRVSFPIVFNDSNVPDTIIVGIAGSNVFSEMPNPTSYLAVDNISFAGTSENIPNSGFENWSTISLLKLSQWESADDEGAGFVNQTLFKTTDSYRGNFAVKLQNNFDFGSKNGEIHIGKSELAPAFPVYSRHVTFNGYFKFFPENSDTAQVEIKLFKNGQIVGNGRLLLTDTTAVYTPFNLPIVYYDPNIIPDSALISIYAGIGIPSYGSSIFYIDNLSFDGFFTSQEKLKVSHSNDLSWNIFPNPAQNEITVSGFSTKAESVYFSVIDLNGKIIQKINKELAVGKFEFQLDMKNVQQGNYIITLQRKGSSQFRKLILTR